MKKLPTKAEIRANLEQEMSLFEKDGGNVTEVPRGLSGIDSLSPASAHTQRLFLEPSAKRTQVPEVIAAIESRRRAKLKQKPTPKPRLGGKRRRKVIYDDFGEPVRKIWVED